MAQQTAKQLKQENPKWDLDTLMYETMEIMEMEIGEELSYIERHLPDFLNEQFNKNLNIPFANYTDASYLHNNALSTKKEGVFSRNLLLCRIINSPLVYGEALYQDNEIELENLTQKSLNFNGINANKRLYEVAGCYYNAILQYLKIIR